MKKISVFASVMSVIAVAGLAACLTGCGSQTETANTTNQAQVVEAQPVNANASAAKAVPLSDVQPVTEANDVKYVYDKQVDRMNDESWELFYSEENQAYLNALKGNVIIFNIDGNYVVTPEQFEQLKVMADEANWCGCFECAVLYGNEIPDPDTGVTWYTMSKGNFWQYYNETYVLTDVDLTDWYGEGGQSLKNLKFDSVSGVQTRFGKITLCTPIA